MDTERRYSNWVNADKFLDLCEKQGFFRHGWTKKKLSSREVLERFILWVVEGHMEFTTDEEGEVFLRLEVKEKEACV